MKTEEMNENLRKKQGDALPSLRSTAAQMSNFVGTLLSICIHFFLYF